MEHTPGPWIDSPNASDAIISTNPDAMADAGMEVEYYGGAVICESVARQNKPLIKAAPEMLTALEAVVKADQRFPDMDIPGYVMIPLRAAIAKARGRPPKKES